MLESTLVSGFTRVRICVQYSAWKRIWPILCTWGMERSCYSSPSAWSSSMTSTGLLSWVGTQLICFGYQNASMNILELAETSMHAIKGMAPPHPSVGCRPWGTYGCLQLAKSDNVHWVLSQGCVRCSRRYVPPGTSRSGTTSDLVT